MLTFTLNVNTRYMSVVAALALLVWVLWFWDWDDRIADSVGSSLRSHGYPAGWLDGGAAAQGGGGTGLEEDPWFKGYGTGGVGGTSDGAGLTSGAGRSETGTGEIMTKGVPAAAQERVQTVAERPSESRLTLAMSPTGLTDDAGTASVVQPSSTAVMQPPREEIWSATAVATSPASAADLGTPTDIPLILFAYHEDPDARRNLQFFIEHALHALADFIFIFNGETDAAELLNGTESNVRSVVRNNTCYDLGAYAEVLKADDGALLKTYSRFIMLNASIRGPFLPFWSRECWSNAYLRELSAEVKLVGMTINCRPDLPKHVQSMLLVTDSVGLNLLLRPEGMGTCPPGWAEAVRLEIGLSDLIRANGYTVKAMMAEANSRPRYVDSCTNVDVTMPGGYEGINLHPYETMFVKTKRGADAAVLAKLTEWHDESNYTSYDYCI